MKEQILLFFFPRVKKDFQKSSSFWWSRQGFGTDAPASPMAGRGLKKTPLQAGQGRRGQAGAEVRGLRCMCFLLQPCWGQGKQRRKGGQRGRTRLPDSTALPLPDPAQPWAPARPSHSPAQHQRGWETPLGSSSATSDLAALHQPNRGAEDFKSTSLGR